MKFNIFNLLVCGALGVLLTSCNRNDVDPTPKSAYISKVFDYQPAPGQFVNKLPEYEVGDTKEMLISKAEKSIVGVNSGAPISLGGFGGYIVFGFDHTITNVIGKRDFRINGNAFFADGAPENGKKGGSCEPGIVMVSYDANKNGQPDDEWFEIAGSEYNSPKTIKNYQITYFRPTVVQENNQGSITIEKYIYWEDNQGQSGYISKNSFNVQPYYPMLATTDRLTFSGTKLANNAVDESGDGTFWVLYSYGYGYADNAPNNNPDSAIDISWAVNAKGQPANLPGIDFVKVYTGVNQTAGWLGESSTEIAGACDLHLLELDINSK